MIGDMFDKTTTILALGSVITAISSFSVAAYREYVRPPEIVYTVQNDIRKLQTLENSLDINPAPFFVHEVAEHSDVLQERERLQANIDSLRDTEEYQAHRKNIETLTAIGLYSTTLAAVFASSVLFRREYLEMRRQQSEEKR